MYTPGIMPEKKKKYTYALPYTLWITSLLVDSLVLQYLYKAFILPAFIFMPHVNIKIFMGIVLIYKLLNDKREVHSDKEYEKQMIFLQQNKGKALFITIFHPAFIFVVGWLINNLHNLK